MSLDYMWCFLTALHFTLLFLCSNLDTPWLDGKHVVFGKAIDGEDVIDKIEAIGSQSGQTSQVVSIKDCGEL